jgi:hypothetical protein
LTPDYATLIRIAASLHDASTTREAEAASTLTLLPKQRERESTGGCQVLLFAFPMGVTRFYPSNWNRLSTNPASLSASTSDV